MKKIIFCLMAIIAVMFSSCTKENQEQENENYKHIEGTYEILIPIESANNVCPFVDNYLFVEYIGGNKVKTSGFFKTDGIFVNELELQFEPTTKYWYQEHWNDYTNEMVGNYREDSISFTRIENYRYTHLNFAIKVNLNGCENTYYIVAHKVSNQIEDWNYK